MKKLFAAAFIILYLPFQGFSWNGNGHMTGGAIAYYYLKSNNPALIPKIIALLQQHPWYNNANQWKPKLAGLSGEQKNLALFMLASTFPDDARDSSYGMAPMTDWHFIDNPIEAAGQHVPLVQPSTPNAPQMIGLIEQRFPGEAAGVAKAIDLCWLFHLIEDIHQPLHTAVLFDTNNPHGDRGGNLTFFALAGTTTPLKLHSYWDGQIGGEAKLPFTNIATLASGLYNNPHFAAAQLPELVADPTYTDWINKESFPLAKTNGYLNGTITGTLAHPTVVPANYQANTLAVTQKRIVLAGIRLGKTLAVLVH